VDLFALNSSSATTNIVTASSDNDEWGDFQDFQTASSSTTSNSLNHLLHTPSTIQTSQSVGCRLATFQDESPVHRFKSTTLNSIPAPHNVPVQVPNLAAPPLSLQKPLPQSQPNSMLDLDDEFGDFALPSTTSFASLTNLSVTASKSFSATFPIDKPIVPISKHQTTFPIDKPLNISNTFPIDKPISTSKTFDIDKPVLPMFQPSLPAVKPLAPSTTEDKYSALRLFLDESDNSSSNILTMNNAFESNLSNVNSSISKNTTPEFDAFGITNGGSEKSISNSTAGFADPFCTTSTLVQADQDMEAEFGEFVEVSSPPFSNDLKNQNQVFPEHDHKSDPSKNISDLLGSTLLMSDDIMPKTSATKDVLPVASMFQHSGKLPTLLPSPTNTNVEDTHDEWSLPASQVPNESDLLSKKVINIRPTSIPFLSNSPPPTDVPIPSLMSTSPPLISSPTSQLQVEEFSLPSEQFGFSDNEVFGIRKVKKENSQPQSIQDIVNRSKSNKPVTESPKIIERTEESNNGDEPSMNSRQGSPVSLRFPSKSPESQSVVSLEFDNHEHPKNLDKKSESDIINTKNNMNLSPVSKCNGYTSEHRSISSPYKEWSTLLSEILKLIESTRDTFDNIISEELKAEVISSDQGKTYLMNLSEVHKVYKRVSNSYGKKLNSEEENSGAEEVGQFCDEIDRDWRRIEEHCELYSIFENMEKGSVVNETVCGICLQPGANLLYCGTSYHSGCANYWVNCVNDSLPNLLA